MGKICLFSIGRDNLFSSYQKKNGNYCISTVGENAIPLINMHNTTSPDVLDNAEIKVTARTTTDPDGTVHRSSNEFVYDAIINPDEPDENTNMDAEFWAVAVPFAGSISEIHYTNANGESIDGFKLFKVIATKTDKFSVNVFSGKNDDKTDWTFDRVAYLVFVSTKPVNTDELNITINAALSSKTDDGKYNIKRRGFKYTIPTENSVYNSMRTLFYSIRVLFYGKSVEDAKPSSVSIKGYGEPCEVNPYPPHKPREKKYDGKPKNFDHDGKKFDANKRQYVRSKPKVYTNPADAISAFAAKVEADYYGDTHVGKPTRRRNDKNRNHRRYD